MPRGLRGRAFVCQAAGRRGRAALTVCMVVALLVPRMTAVAAPATQPGGVILDGYGGIHAFGGASVDTSGAPYWGGWDIARAVAVLPDGSGGWTLDGWGGIHTWGTAPVIEQPASWPGWDIARDLVPTSVDASGNIDGRQGYVLDGFGGLHPWGGAPLLSGPYPGADVVRSLLVDTASDGSPDGGWELDADGTLHAFGGAVHKAAPVTVSGKPLWRKLRGTATAGYLVGHWGAVQTWGGLNPYWSGYGDWGTWDIERDIALLRADNPSSVAQPMSSEAAAIFAAASRPSGGVTLDGFGGLHRFGESAVAVGGAPYWKGWDIARAIEVRDDGSGGWTLDGWGGVHRWGSGPGITVAPAWPGWDIARAFAVTSVDSNGVADGRSGYILDAFGGVHPWGGAPAIGAPPYMAGFDVYRAIVIHRDSGGVPDGGWAMDDTGRTAAFGAAPGIGDASAHAGRPMFAAMHATEFGWYSVTHTGVVETFSGYVQPSWTGWIDWGGWGIVRDIALLNPADAAAPSQPLSVADAQTNAQLVNGRYILSVPMTKQVHPLDCEAATLQMVLAARGTQVSQDWELQYWGADLRPAVKDAAGNIVQWGDPYVSFVGNVNASEWNAGGYGIYYPPLVAISQYLGHTAIGKEGWTVSALFDLVVSGYPAAVEGSYNMAPATPRTWTAWDGRAVQYVLNNHVFALVGIDFGRQTVIINDPYTATVKEFSWASFARSFTYIDNMATVVG